MIMQDIKQELS